MRFTGNIRRGFRAMYGGKRAKTRNARPTKLRRLRDDIQDAVEQSQATSLPTTPDTPEVPDTRADTAEVASEVDEDGDSRFEDAPSEVLAQSPKVEYAEAERPLESNNGDEIQLLPETDDHLSSGEPAHDLEIGSHMLTEEEESKLLDSYLVFKGEDESDYTVGPARMILATDGLKPCVAMLMTLDLSAKIQRAIRAQRDCAESERLAQEKSRVLHSYESKLRREIRSCEARLKLAALASEADQSAENTESLEKQLGRLRNMLDNARIQRESLADNIETRHELLRRIQAEANAMLEEAFISCELLEPQTEEPITPVEELDIRQQYDEWRKMEEEDDGELVPASPLDTNRDYLTQPVQLTPEEQAQEDIKTAYWTAWERLNEAQSAFNRKNVDRNMELQALLEQELQSNEPCLETPSQFDGRWVLRNQEITRELIEAEAAFDKAKAAAAEAGLNIRLDYQESGFADDEEDGRHSVSEEDCINSAPQPLIHSWLHTIPADAGSSCTDEADVDEWDAESPGLSDSVSVVAEGRERRRIDKWRRLVGL